MDDSWVPTKISKYIPKAKINLCRKAENGCLAYRVIRRIVALVEDISAQISLFIPLYKKKN